MGLTCVGQDKRQADGKEDGDKQTMPRTDQTHMRHDGQYPIFTQTLALPLSITMDDVTHRFSRFCHRGMPGMGRFVAHPQRIYALDYSIKDTLVKSTFNDRSYATEKGLS